MVNCRFSSEGFDLSFRAVVGASGTLDEDDVRSRFGEGEGEGLTDSAGAAREKRGAVLQGEEVEDVGHGCSSSPD